MQKQISPIDAEDKFSVSALRRGKNRQQAFSFFIISSAAYNSRLAQHFLYSGRYLARMGKRRKESPLIFRQIQALDLMNYVLSF